MATSPQIAKRTEILEALEYIESLQTIPVTMNQIMQKLSDPNADIQEIAEFLLHDQVLTAKVLRLVNSPFVGLPREIKSLKQAIILLGLRRIRDLVFTTLTIQHFRLNSTTLTANHFWSHALGCAKGAVLLDPSKEYPRNDAYYVAGLLHDIGELILAQYFQNEFDQVYKYASENSMSLYLAEDHILGINHCEIGARLAEKWRFPATMVQVIRNHHTPELAETDSLIISIISLSDILTRLLGLNYGVYEAIMVSIKELPSFSVLRNHYHAISDLDWERFSMELMDQFQQIALSVRRYFQQNGN